jgi:hypothetical protein
VIISDKQSSYDVGIIGSQGRLQTEMKQVQGSPNRYGVITVLKVFAIFFSAANAINNLKL